LLRAATDTQQGVFDLFPTAEVFPSLENLTAPASKVTLQYISQGQTFLQRYLPFWIASPLERFYLLALPILLLLYPLLRNTPTAYGFFMRRRVYIWYTRIRQIELAIEQYSVAELAAHIERLESLEQQLAESFNVPSGYLQLFYDLRIHIRLVIDRLRQRKTFLEARVSYAGATESRPADASQS